MRKAVFLEFAHASFYSEITVEAEELRHKAFVHLLVDWNPIHQ